MKYQGLLLKNGLKFKVNLEILTIRVNHNRPLEIKDSVNISLIVGINNFM